MLVLAAAFFQKFGLMPAFVALVFKYWHFVYLLLQTVGAANTIAELRTYSHNLPA